MNAPLLRVTGLSRSFGGLKALQGVDLSVSPNQVVAVIGPNGAGKTTFFNCLSGIYAPDTGRVELAGRDLTGRAPHEVSRAGLSRSFQNIRLFPEMTCLQNVLVGRFSRMPTSPLGALLRLPSWRRSEAEHLERSRELLDFAGLSEHAEAWARNLPYGLQRRLEVARALATEPKVLLLDEPGAGMNPGEIAEMTRLVRAIRERGVAVVLIEHHMRLVMEISDRILVLDHGEPIAEGTPEEIRRDPRVVEAYLGSSST